MKKYVKPIMKSEEFITNEYISACWKIGCNTSEANKIEGLLHNNPIGGHRSGECGNELKQSVYLNSSGVPVGMYELDTAFNGANLRCDIYTDSTYSTLMTSDQIANIKPGDKLYWITVGEWFGEQVYHHVGEVGAVNTTRPNAS